MALSRPQAPFPQTRRRVAAVRRHVSITPLDRRERRGPPSLASRSSHRSAWSVLSGWSAGSAVSLWSFGSVLSIGSAGSVLSIGSVGSILSIGSAGSVGSIGSAGSVFAIGASGQRPPGSSSGDDARHLALVEPGATLLGLAALAAAARRSIA
jgi:hypothetical protein